MEHSFLQRLNSKRAGIIPIIIVAATLTSKYNIECSFSALMLHCVSALTKIPFLIRYVQCMVLSPPTHPPALPGQKLVYIYTFLLLLLIHNYLCVTDRRFLSLQKWIYEKSIQLWLALNETNSKWWWRRALENHHFQGTLESSATQITTKGGTYFSSTS